MSEIGALIIRLQAETAQFRDDMGKVKRDLDGLKDKTGEVAGSMKYSMFEARGGLMLVEESVGVRLPRHLNSLIATIPGVGQAFAMMLPIAGVVVAIEIIGKLIEKHKEMKEQAELIARAQASLGGTISTVMGGLQDKLLQAGIKADQLRNDHFAALQKQLALIDHQTMRDLAQQFDVLAKAADEAFAQLKTHWYQFGDGSEGAKHSLADFQSQYELLLKTGKGDEANKLLDAKIQREEKILALQKQAAANQMVTGGQQGNYAKYEEAIVQLKQLGVGFTEKEIKSEQDLVDVLHAQADARAIIQKTAGVEKGNDAAEYTKTWEEAIDKRAAAERKFYDEHKKLADEAKKKGLEESASLAEAQAKATEAVNKLGVQQALLSQATTLSDYRIYLGKQKDALEANHALGLVSEQNYYENLKAMYQREHEAKMASLQNQIDQTTDPDKKLHLQEQLTQETIRYNSEVSKTQTAVDKIGASWGNYFAKMKSETLDLSTTIRTQMQSSITQFTNSFSQSMAKCIVENRSLGQATRQIAVQMAESWLELAIKRMITDRLITASHIAGNETQVASDKTAGMQSQLAAAKAGAAKAYQAMAGIPIIGPELGVVAAAAAFTFMMAFEQGGKIPGQGAVPIIGHGGETVVTKTLTDRVEAAEAHHGNSYGDTHVHSTFAPTIHAVDANGVEAMLKKHSAIFHREMRSSMRKMNR